MMPVTFKFKQSKWPDNNYQQSTIPNLRLMVTVVLAV